MPDITLEPRTAAHAEALFPMLSEPEIYQYLDERPPSSLGALQQRFARSESLKSPDGTEDWLNWVVLDESGSTVGMVQTTIFSNADANVAYVFGRAYWGRNLAYRAVENMLGKVIAGYEVKRFIVTIERDHERSIRLASRLGFVRADASESAARKIAESEILMVMAVRT